MKQTWKGLVVGGLTGAGVGMFLDAVGRGRENVEAVASRAREAAPGAAERVRSAVGDAATRLRDSDLASDLADRGEAAASVAGRKINEAKERVRDGSSA